MMYLEVMRGVLSPEEIRQSCGQLSLGLDHSGTLDVSLSDLGRQRSPVEAALGLLAWQDGFASGTPAMTVNLHVSIYSVFSDVSLPCL